MLSMNLSENIKTAREIFTIGKSFDYIEREILLGVTPAYILTLNGFTETDVLQWIISDLQNDAYTSNINLSQKLYSEMVIYVYNNSEVAKNDVLSCDTICKPNIIEVNNCVSSNNSESKLKININTATLEDLNGISGIGESKAKSIIEYRNSNGLFRTIEDIKNVSGIGDSLFEKIKNNITV